MVRRGRELKPDWIRSPVGGASLLGYLTLCSIVADCVFQLVRLRSRGRADCDRIPQHFVFFCFFKFLYNRNTFFFTNVIFLQSISGWQFSSISSGGQRLAAAVLEQSAPEAH